MPLDKQGPSFLAARLSNETSGRGGGKDPKEYFEGERPNLDRIQAVSPRFVAETNCSFFSGLVGFALPPSDNCIGRARRVRERATRKNGGDAGGS